MKSGGQSDDMDPSAGGKRPSLVDGDKQPSGFMWPTAVGNEVTMTVCQGFLVLMACLLPNIAAVLLLSDMGWGMEVYNQVATSTMSLSGDAAMTFAVLSICLLYILDILRWKNTIVQVIFAMGPVLLITAGAFLKARKYPWAPLLFTLFLVPFTNGVIRSSACRSTKRWQFYVWVGGGMLIASVSVFIAWAWWISDGHVWSRDTKDDLAGRSAMIYYNIIPDAADYDFNYIDHCRPGTSSLAEFDTETSQRLEAACRSAASVWVLLWWAPCVVGLSNLVVASFCLVHGVWLHDQSSTSVVKALKHFMIMLVLLFGGMYGCVSFTSIALGSALMAFFAAALLMLVVWSFLEIGSDAMVHMASQSPFASRLAAAWRSDWIRAIAVGAANIFIPIFFILNACNQKVRKCCGTNDTDGRYTREAQWLLEEIKEWDWASILTKVAILAEVFFTFQVGVSKVTYIFLSWLSRKLATINFVVVCFLVFVIGNIMFLLPPVPGIPVYVFTGIVIADQGSRKLGESGFALGIMIAIGVAFLNKMAACTGQYMIGYFMGKKVKIQQLIKVDSVPTRAIESIVKRTGLDPAKVAILIGGPDWPTSVGCGMVKVNIPQMLIGTSPVLFLLSPCVLAGAFISKGSAGGPDSIFPMLTNVALVTATATQTASMLAAAWCIMREIQERGEELAKPRPEHAAVAELTRREMHAKRLYAEVTKWSKLGGLDKGILIFMWALLEMSCFMFLLLASACFRPFSVDKDINAPWHEGGLNGDPLSIVFPLGWVGLGLFFTGVLLHIVHCQRMKSFHKVELRANPPPADGGASIEGGLPQVAPPAGSSAGGSGGKDVDGKPSDPQVHEIVTERTVEPTAA